MAEERQRLYEDFLTGFVVDDRRVWGRPVGVAVARDGALLVSENANGTVRRVSYRGGRAISRSPRSARVGGTAAWRASSAASPCAREAGA